MTDSNELRRIESIEELVGLVSLKEIRFYEVRSRAIGPGDGNDEEPEFELGYSERSEPTELEDRFSAVVRTDVAEYMIDLAALYGVAEPCTTPRPIRIDFAERIRFMTVFPYIREALTSGAARLGKRGPLLNFVRPGDMKIAAEEGAAKGD